MLSDVSSTAVERELYRNLRKSVPVIDAAICKLIRLLGTFKVKAKNSRCQQIIDDFMRNVCTNGTGMGINGFVFSYMESLLTYGEAVGEMVLSRDGKRIAALYNASVEDVEIREGSSPLDLVICTKGDGVLTPVKYSQLVFATLLNPEPGTVRGSSLLKGLPFVSSVLLKIFESIKTNWERVGNVRFAVTCKPSDNAVFTEDSARMIADEWSKAMRSESVCDFVSVGDVSVKVIGAENQIPDCDVPIKHLLEQIVAKLGLPPFLLGFSWSSTERMSEQQADILTSELEYYRTLLNPIITKIIRAVLRLEGYTDSFEVEWDDINMQDAVQLSNARLNNARAEQIEFEIGKVKNDRTD
nr:MAG TPA: HK97 Family Phage Portal Protein, HK97 family, Portal, Corynebacterium [Caudoviricetes sp.]